MVISDLVDDPTPYHGEVFTRRWIVELILDLVGYTADRDLAGSVLVEPSCGAGAFLVPVVERLVASAVAHGHDFGSLRAAIRAFDLVDTNAIRSREAVATTLVGLGVDLDVAMTLADTWVIEGDFLRHGHVDGTADFVVGNPPYIRLEDVPRATMDDYRRICRTMRGRADIYVGFIERGLQLLNPDGVLGFICADRWMRNQYGADLRELVAAEYAVDTVIAMHDVDAFEDAVSAYPAITVFRKARQRTAVAADARSTFDEQAGSRLTSWIRHGSHGSLDEGSFEATRVNGWFTGRDLWPAGSPGQLALIADLESRFAPLESTATGTRVGIGVATGCDDVYITNNADIVEHDRLLPVLRAQDIATGMTRWSGDYLVNPWDGGRLVDLGSYPRLAAYLEDNQRRLRGRHIAKKRPTAWYRTIDRVSEGLTERPKLLLPDIKAAAHPVLDAGGHYPHHNLYYVISDAWDLEVLGGILLSDVANLFVGTYCVKMRGGTYRFQAQYIRRIRVPDPGSIDRRDRRALVEAFRMRDAKRATAIAERVYGITEIARCARETA
ncbi:MAG: Eco57I restriction-modification methylase domain-containing protein [Actinobacteria bacterium]|nr:Eco57I restriction-modification methylase domain-containing protein [Actinomycetota bacterium]